VSGGGEAVEHVHGRVRRFGMRTVRSVGADDAGTPSLPGVSHRFVNVAVAEGRLTLHVAEAGVGEPVLMLHGWPGHWYSWRQLVPHLSESYRLLMPDLRGFGWSDAPGSGYDPRTFAADTLALLDALELDRVRLVGHASCLLYRSYLRTARDIFIRRRYDHDYLTVPTRLVFGTDDFHVPSAYVAGSAQHARDPDVEFVPGCGHFLPEERSDIAAARVELFLR
jgi:pimeloyl-ACP methyl ester carboxylesterase